MTAHHLPELTNLKEFITVLDAQRIASHQEDLDHVAQRLLETYRACLTQRNALARISRLPPETMLHIFAEMNIEDLIHCASSTVATNSDSVDITLHPPQHHAYAVGGVTSCSITQVFGPHTRSLY